MATSAVDAGARQLSDEVSQVVATVAPIPPAYKGQEHLYNELTPTSLTELIHDSQAGAPPL